MWFTDDKTGEEGCNQCKECVICNENDPEAAVCDAYRVDCELGDYDPDCVGNVLWNYGYGVDFLYGTDQIVDRYAQTTIGDYDTTTRHRCDSLSNFATMFNFVYECIYELNNWQMAVVGNPTVVDWPDDDAS